MRNELTIRVSGEAGQGMQAVSSVLAKAFRKAGLHVFLNHDFMSRVRGGNNFSQIRISNVSVRAPRGNCDIIIALDNASAGLHASQLTSRGTMVMDSMRFAGLTCDAKSFDVPIYDMAKRIGGSDLFVNTACSGVIAGMTRMDFNCLEQALKETFAAKSADIVKKNIDIAREGYVFSSANFKEDTYALRALPVRESLLMDGHQALALAAVRAGCKFYSGYPMSPSTSVMENIARYAKEFNIVVEQAEDEIAAINMTIGASCVGVRSMTATSGGGFALMTEGLSLAGMFEAPIVVVDAQRPGPATGFPTRTEQADLDFLIHAGHGEFARVVFAPGTIEQAFYLTVKAFNLAEKYQVPALIMTDQYLADSSYDFAPFDMDRAVVARSIVSREGSKNITGYQRYQLTKNGISPLAIPSWIEPVVYADSDEHTEAGHITEDAAMRVSMVEKRFYKKMKQLSREIERPSAYRVRDARIVLVGFGSTYNVMREACDTFKERIGFLHLSQVWPFPSSQVQRLLRGKKIYTVENNAAGQLAKLMRRETGIEPAGTILKFDGRPFDVDFLSDKIAEVWKRGGRKRI